MPLSRFCAAALGAIILSFAGNSYATGEDAPLPGDFQPPRQSKSTSKPAPGNGGSNKANDVPARNIPPATVSKSQEKTGSPTDQPRQSQAETRRSKRGDSQPAARKATRQLKQNASQQRTAKARSKLRNGKQAVQGNKTLRAGKKSTRQLRAEAKRTRTGKAIGSRKASASKRSLAARKRQSSLQQAGKPGVKAKRNRTTSGKQTLAQRKARKATVNGSKRSNISKASQRKARKATLNTASKRANLSKTKARKSSTEARRQQQRQKG